MIKRWLEFNEAKVYGSKIQAKIDLLKDLSLDLSDMGLEVDIWNGSWKDDNQYGGSLSTHPASKSILMTIVDLDSVLDDNNYYEKDLFHKKEILDFEEKLKLYGMKFRMKSGNAQNGVIFFFDKHGRMTDSDVLNR